MVTFYIAESWKSVTRF